MKKLLFFQLNFVLNISLKSLIANSKRYGSGKSAQLIQYLNDNTDELGFIHKKVLDMVQETQISKVTIIAVLKFLESNNYIKRIKTGIYQILTGDDYT